MMTTITITTQEDIMSNNIIF